MRDFLALAIIISVVLFGANQTEVQTTLYESAVEHCVPGTIQVHIGVILRTYDCKLIEEG